MTLECCVGFLKPESDNMTSKTRTDVVLCTSSGSEADAVMHSIDSRTDAVHTSVSVLKLMLYTTLVPMELFSVILNNIKTKIFTNITYHTIILNII